MGYGGWGQGMASDNATGIQPIDFGEARSLDFRGQVLRFFLYLVVGWPRAGLGPGFSART